MSLILIVCILLVTISLLKITVTLARESEKVTGRFFLWNKVLVLILIDKIVNFPLIDKKNDNISLNCWNWEYPFKLHNYSQSFCHQKWLFLPIFLIKLRIVIEGVCDSEATHNPLAPSRVIVWHCTVSARERIIKNKTFHVAPKVMKVLHALSCTRRVRTGRIIMNTQHADQLSVWNASYAVYPTLYVDALIVLKYFWWTKIVVFVKNIDKIVQ